MLTTNARDEVTLSYKMTSREFNQDVARAKRAAANAPVFVTDRGALAHVLLSIEEYQRLQALKQFSEPVQSKKTLAELLYMPEVADIEFDPPRLQMQLRPVSFD